MLTRHSPVAIITLAGSPVQAAATLSDRQVEQISRERAFWATDVANSGGEGTGGSDGIGAGPVCC
jgi:hypothetical protein